MSRTCNYAAFYVSTPFNETSLGAHAAKDFCYYSMLKAWKGKDSSFSFKNAHDTTYDVRDESDWEKTLKPRLHERLRNSKNIIFFLSSNTKNSIALSEELDYGINTLGLPVIVVYPEFSEQSELLIERKNFKPGIIKLWGSVSKFQKNMDKVPTLHIAMKKEVIKKALENEDFMVQTAIKSGRYFY